MRYTRNFKGRSYGFADLKTLLAKVSPLRSADELVFARKGNYIDPAREKHMYAVRITLADGLRFAPTLHSPTLDAKLKRMRSMDGGQ